MHRCDGSDVLFLSRGCSRCARPLPRGGGAADWLLCDACLRAADANITAKRSILLPQPEPDSGALSALA